MEAVSHHRLLLSLHDELKISGHKWCLVFTVQMLIYLPLLSLAGRHGPRAMASDSAVYSVLTPQTGSACREGTWTRRKDSHAAGILGENLRPLSGERMTSSALGMTTALKRTTSLTTCH